MRREKPVRLETVQSVLAAFTAAIVGLWAIVGLGSGVTITAVPAAGAAPAIGTAAAKGSFRVDDATVTGNATLFEGVEIETRQVTSSLDLASGPRLVLGTDSRGRIFGDRLILERGSGEMRDAAGFQVEARGLTIRTETGHSAARIQLTGAKGVQVAALAGGARVLNSRGLLVAELNPGMALAFEPQGGGASSEPEKFTGCLRASNGHFLITDDLTNVTVELAGPGVERESGNQVQVTGIMDPTGAPVSGATQYVRVNGLKRLARGCPANKAAAAGAGGAKGSSGKAAGGLSATTLAVIGGVAAAAATAGGLAAAGTFSSGSSNAPVSR